MTQQIIFFSGRLFSTLLLVGCGGLYAAAKVLRGEPSGRAADASERKPSEDFRKRLYDMAAARYDESVEGREKWLGIRKARRRLFSNSKGAVLEIGSGTGLNIEPILSGKVETLVCLDSSAAMCKHLAAKIKQQRPAVPVLVLRGSAEDLPFEDSSFDSVISAFCLCAVEKPEKCLQEARRVLRWRGLLLLVEKGLPSNPVVRSAL